MRRLLLAMLVAAACKHSTSSSSTSHTETATTTESTSSETGTQTTVTTTTEAPGKTTTTVEDYANEPDSGGDVPPDAGERDGVAGPDVPVAPSRPAPRQPRLVRRTVTVTERGAETSETHQQATTQAQGASETRAQGKEDVQVKETEKSAPALSCAFGGWLVTLVIGIAVLGLIYGALKLRKVI